MSFNLNIQFTINSWNSVYFILNNIIIMSHNLAEKIFLFVCSLLCTLCLSYCFDTFVHFLYVHGNYIKTFFLEIIQFHFHAICFAVYYL